MRDKRAADTMAVQKSACVSVTDSGEGIEQASLDKLFVPFERLDAAAAGIEETGLGLAVSRSLIEAMGGTIGAASIGCSTSRTRSRT